MNDDFSSRRRQFLRSASVGGAALLAGCSEQLGLAQSDNGTDDGNSTDDSTDGDTMASGGERKVGVVATVDQQALQQLQVEIQQQVQSGNITQQEAQQQYQERQKELIGEAVDSLTESLPSSITVQESYQDLGAVVITGPAGPLLGTLELDAAQSLVLASQVEAAASSSGSASTNSS